MHWANSTAITRSQDVLLEEADMGQVTKYQNALIPCLCSPLLPLLHEDLILCHFSPPIWVSLFLL